VGLEWLFPKALEVFDNDRDVFDAMDAWVEAGDWMCWTLTGGGPGSPRSACQV
jgi:L-ribulokinase